jgi:hypothetical protein
LPIELGQATRWERDHTLIPPNSHVPQVLTYQVGCDVANRPGVACGHSIPIMVIEMRKDGDEGMPHLREQAKRIDPKEGHRVEPYLLRSVV